MASAMEFLVAEMCEAVGDVVKETGVKRIKPRHIMLAIQGDD